MKTACVCGTLIGALFALTGCTESTSSKNIKTGGISATIVVTATSESSSAVVATLQVGGNESNTYVILEGGDVMTASAGSDSKQMTAESEGVYRAEFGTGADGTEFVVDLVRGDPNDVPAPNSRGTLPGPFTLGALEGDLSRSTDPLTITWDPSGSSNDMDLEIDGDCIFTFTETLPDNGSATIAADSLDSTGGNEPKACTLDAKLSRVSGGSADAAYDPEKLFTLKQLRSGKIANSQP